MGEHYIVFVNFSGDGPDFDTVDFDLSPDEAQAIRKLSPDEIRARLLARCETCVDFDVDSNWGSCLCERTNEEIEPNEYCSNWQPLPEPPKGVTGNG